MFAIQLQIYKFFLKLPYKMQKKIDIIQTAVNPPERRLFTVLFWITYRKFRMTYSKF